MIFSVRSTSRGGAAAAAKILRQFFKAKAAGKRCKSSLVRCWAAQAKTPKKRPQDEPLSHFRHEICL